MPAKDVRVEFRCSAAEKLMFEEAAEQEGINLGAWFRALGHERALEVIIPGNTAGKQSPFQPGFGLNEED